MTIGYILKLGLFLKKTRNFATNTKETIQTFVFEAKLTLEVYKSFIIAGALLLPVPVFAYGPGAEAFGGSYQNTQVFYKIKALLEQPDKKK